jgi:hypothetical protein
MLLIFVMCITWKLKVHNFFVYREGQVKRTKWSRSLPNRLYKIRMFIKLLKSLICLLTIIRVKIRTTKNSFMFGLDGQWSSFWSKTVFPLKGTIFCHATGGSMSLNALLENVIEFVNRLSIVRRFAIPPPRFLSQTRCQRHQILWPWKMVASYLQEKINL